MIAYLLKKDDQEYFSNFAYSNPFLSINVRFLQIILKAFSCLVEKEERERERKANTSTKMIQSIVKTLKIVKIFNPISLFLSIYREKEREKSFV